MATFAERLKELREEKTLITSIQLFYVVKVDGILNFKSIFRKAGKYSVFNYKQHICALSKKEKMLLFYQSGSSSGDSPYVSIKK